MSQEAISQFVLCEIFSQQQNSTLSLSELNDMNFLFHVGLRYFLTPAVFQYNKDVLLYACRVLLKLIQLSSAHCLKSPFRLCLFEKFSCLGRPIASCTALQSLEKYFTVLLAQMALARTLYCY